jgi:hypothetical protein
MTVNNKDYLINPKFDIIMKKKYSNSPCHLKYYKILLFLIKKSNSRV